jgi:hypothetical protein
MAPPNWYLVLEAARRLSKGAGSRRDTGPGFTSRDLGFEIGIRRDMPTREEQAIEDLRVTRIASAWCYKLRNWGYLKTTMNTQERRWSRVYLLTPAGLKAKEPVSRRVYAPVPESPAKARRTKGR